MVIEFRLVSDLRLRSMVMVWETGAVRLVLDAWHVSTIMRSSLDRREILKTLRMVPLGDAMCTSFAIDGPRHHVTVGGGLPGCH